MGGSVKHSGAVIAALCACLLAACDDSDTGNARPTATKTITPVASPSAVATASAAVTATSTRQSAATSTAVPPPTSTPAEIASPTPVATLTPVDTATAVPSSTPTQTPTPTPTDTATITATATATSHTAPDQPLLGFDDAAAVTANGDYPAADPKTVCVADDRRFLAEIIEDHTTEVPKRLADVKTAPSAVMVSGVASEVSLGGGDFPFDHTFGSDFNMDVVLDAPYAMAAQRMGVVMGDMHVELAEGQLPHQERPPGPATGQGWDEMSEQAREDLYMPFVPDDGDRVLVLGHWVVDCGHTDFQTELHPVMFMATSRVNGTKTVANAFYNPYRETEEFNLDPLTAVAFSDPDRFDPPGAGPFPNLLIVNVLRLQDEGPAPFSSVDHLESWAMLEPNLTPPVAWRVCAPSGSSGTRLDVKYHWITRPGVDIAVTDDAISCATVRVTMQGATVRMPTPRVCVTPWPFLDLVAGQEAGIDNLDLQAEIGAFIAPMFKSRLDPDPLLNCYDPLQGPPIESEPPAQQVETSEDLLLPFYGAISVELVN